MDFTHPHFAEPQWLWIAIVFPLGLLALERYAAWRRRGQLLRFAAPERAVELMSHCHPLRRRVKNLLLVTVAALMGVALARPQWGEQTEQVQNYGEDILVLLDTSRSMLATDVRPSRLERAKLAVLDFTRQHARGRMGLLIFAGQAFLQCPLTYDHDAFCLSVTAVDHKAIAVPGTDLGRALEEALISFEHNSRRKYVIAITDGEDLEGGGIKVAKTYADKGVTIYAIGVGTEAGSPIQAINPQGALELVRDAKGNVVQSRLDQATLQAVASATGGQYYPLGAFGDGMTQVRRGIGLTSEASDTVRRRKLGVDRFHWPVGLALLLLVIESLMGEGRRRREDTRPDQAPATGRLTGANPVSMSRFGGVVSGLVSIMIAGGSVPAQTNPSVISSNNPQTNPGVIASTNIQNRQSQAEENPRTPREFFNTGTQKLKTGKLQEAEGFLQNAAASQQSGVQERAIYNLGHTRFRLGTEALKQAPEAGKTRESAQSAADLADIAIKAADQVLAQADPRVQSLIAAYQNGRGARKLLKEAVQALKQALEAHQTTLFRWERASSDFKSAFELDPSDRDAQFNGEVVDRRIAALIDQLNQLQMMMPFMGKKQEQIKERLDALKKKIPKGSQPDDEEGDDEEEPPKEPQKGGKEPPAKEGKQKMMTREEAMHLLETMKLDGERKLPMGFEKTGQPADRATRNW